MQSELSKARGAIAAGNTDEALVLLWNAVEPARMAGDRETLEEIARLAQAIPGREAADLVNATGIQPAESAGSKPDAKETPKASKRRALVWLAIVLAFALFNLVQDLVPNETRTTQPTTQRLPGVEPVTTGLHLVPLDRYPAEELGELVPTVVPTAGIVVVRHQVVLDPSTYDPRRKQYVAEKLLTELRNKFALTGSPTMIVGVTSLDMYSERQMKEPRVSVARSDDGVFVVISTFAFGSLHEGRQVALGRAILQELRRGYAGPRI